ncbi:uncharacterized protein BO97DRAFT_421275 [Aspergillus homomorphus CBS 101889]|uniref:Enoyl reductase (ER) domain-containing protein n=1 Tax=Aspergillus homomorphus (strain CBS 101889) TaxID=1450537 RepID=A0A395ICZ2_ASPHC|nr:hypothetical protein BO97DRAFT_421275 [Aspergillus homomorphus CBS 101889]RAL16034.1 hypothetical protein BO97DRAFT_421275 [Aspergillus homomorphus CBS 101889]
MELGRLRRGQGVLIHAAAGATGQAAIQLAHHLCAKIYATTESSRAGDAHFKGGILKETKGRGVDLVINHPTLMVTYNAPHGTVSLPTTTYLDVVRWIQERPHMLQHAVQNVMPLIEAGHLSLGTICKTNRSWRD